MKRVELTLQFTTILTSANRLSAENKAQAVVILADVPYDFAAVKQQLDPIRVLVASDKPEVQRAAREDGVDLVPLLRQVETRQVQLSQALLEAIADDLLKSGDKIVALYGSFERETIDTLSIINLGDHLARLTSRDLQRLETQVPLETLRIVVDLAVQIGREGREGKPVGTMFVVGDHRKAIRLSHEGVHDPFRGYSRKERELRDPRVRESVKELAQLDGAFVVAAEGYVVSAGRILDAQAHGVTLSKGLGARHWAAAAISKSTKAIAIAISESTGSVRLFQNGAVVLRIEPMDRAMKWHDFETDRPPPATDS
jgi:DNA integrity scanning protein DisA with diadenylate cyclase activity